MENLDGRQALVDSAHEAFEEDDFGEADAQVVEVAGKRVEVVELVQLHCIGEIQSHVLQVLPHQTNQD